MAGAKAAAGGADAAVANPVDDEIFRRMETEFCRDLGLDASNNNTAATA
jgi:hypothetical protein